jgi:hypothetical protein
VRKFTHKRKRGYFGRFTGNNNDNIHIFYQPFGGERVVQPVHCTIGPSHSCFKKNIELQTSQNVIRKSISSQRIRLSIKHMTAQIAIWQFSPVLLTGRAPCSLNAACP